MLTVIEAAKRAKRDPETIRRWIRAGKLTSWKVGNQHVIDEDDLSAAIRGVGAEPLTGADQSRAERAHQIAESVAPYLTPAPAAVDPWLTQIVGRVVRTIDPVRIILFGSRARGDGRPDSDYDLLVVLDRVDDRRATRMEIRRSFADLPVAADVLVAPLDEVEGRVPGRPIGTAWWALQEGQRIYDRGDVS